MGLTHLRQWWAGCCHEEAIATLCGVSYRVLRVAELTYLMSIWSHDSIWSAVISDLALYHCPRDAVARQEVAIERTSHDYTSYTNWMSKPVAVDVSDQLQD